MADDNAASARSAFLAVEPQLYVSNIEAACDYYGERLGFTVAFVYGDPPYYAQVYRDGVQLNLRARGVKRRITWHQMPGWRGAITP